MFYQSFVSQICDMVQTQLRGEARVHHIRNTKNNGVPMDGITINRTADRMAPVIYLRDYYVEAELGRPLPDIVREIIFLGTSRCGIPVSYRDELLELVEHLDSARPYITCRIINSDKNREQLEALPHVDFLDLSFIFAILVESPVSGFMSTVISRDMCMDWGVAEQELLSISLQNMRPLLHPRITSLAELILEDDERPDEDDAGLYVVSGRCDRYGAACVFTPGLLRNFSEKMNSDLYLLPSSVHEILLLPGSFHPEYHSLVSTVSEVNQTVLDEADLLSDHVYLYERDSNTIRIPGAPIPAVCLTDLCDA